MDSGKHLDVSKLQFCVLHHSDANTALVQDKCIQGGGNVRYFALAMAFAGNDLVNFIGVPLAGFSAYTDFMANGNGEPMGYLMNSLNGPAKTPFLFYF